MTADVLYLAALQAAADGDPDAVRDLLALRDDPEAMAALLAPGKGGEAAPAATFRRESPGA